MISPNIGDLQFTFHPGGVLSEAIAHVTHAKISHVQMIVDIGVNGTLQVISAERQGLTPKWVHPESYPWQCILTYEDISMWQRKDMVDWLWKMQRENQGYDVWGLASFIVNVDLNDERKSFCSEICYQAYEQAGIYLLDGVDHAFVSPRDLWIIPQLVTLDGTRKEIR